MTIKVECHSSYDRSPYRFFLKDKEIEILEVVDRWLSSDYQYFKVRGSDGGLYILKRQFGDWTLTLFDENHLREDPRLEKPSHVH